MRQWILVLLSVGAAATTMAETRFDSGPERVQVIELFTSEGCSSCPPADRWLSTLRDDPGLFVDFVPMAFHVDYWDYIGWRDRLASSDHSARQRRHREAGRIASVYTPGFVVDGREWRGFFGDRRLPDRERVAAGRLRLTIDDNVVVIDYEALAGIDDPVAELALLGSGLESAVTRGENRGRTLRHEFAVLNWQTLALTPLSGDRYRARATLPASTPAPHRTAIAAWISAAPGAVPIQAVGGWLP